MRAPLVLLLVLAAFALPLQAAPFNMIGQAFEKDGIRVVLGWVAEDNIAPHGHIRLVASVRTAAGNTQGLKPDQPVSGLVIEYRLRANGGSVDSKGTLLPASIDGANYAASGVVMGEFDHYRLFCTIEFPGMKVKETTGASVPRPPIKTSAPFNYPPNLPNEPVHKGKGGLFH